MLIAQITDLHILPQGELAYGRVDTAACLARAVSRLLTMEPRPDLVVATGDLVDAGSAREYAHLRRLLAPLELPLYLLPGNHDSRDGLRAAFPDHNYLPQSGTFLQYCIEDWPVRLIALDTIIPGEPGGRLCDERLAWLSDRLSEQTDRPTLIMMHHPPFATGIGHMDHMGLAEPEALAAILRRHSNVARVICGHDHRSIQAGFAGTIASVAPSTAHQVMLDLTTDAEARYVLEPPGFHLHLWRAGYGMVTHAAFVDRYPGPYPFT
jgi:3',5'-cyclic AMP phosphodiesterase CpdA